MSEAQAVWPPQWAYVEGEPTLAGSYRQRPEEFVVDEVLGFTPEGEGEHLWVWVEKRGVTTPDLARLLAKRAEIAVRDVGFSGLKDRDGVTRQWLSLALPGRELAAGWDDGLAERGVQVLDARRHPRKLKRGVHRANRFSLRLRGEATAASATFERWQRRVAEGIPNYFGPQRFGPGGRNLQRAEALFARGWRKRDDPQGLLLSTARSYLFNEVLSARVADGSWCRAIAGDVFNLDGSNSRFAAETLDAALEARLASGDLHPTAMLWGVGRLESAGEVAERETRIANAHPTLRDGLEAAGARQARRPLRVRLADPEWRTTDDGVELSFTLPRGAFATALLRELFTDASLT
ncbi:tRNA pseudouridine(13) synthase TruD [Salinicola aestuarinus]|uniref:tRNA pseudouridine(13) synthase TruD n=1 Tax=Salinicola aestuarinus TaxID=1949082 RepID=UPI000DA1EEF2|nr:tRNA pseudouridine(13) synthase TruD [Salinicola aestuarinus]